ncbi:hypothetical protein E9993_01845 [Labilibacter sediminis]|nr:hypothetical protein E9993_01845 [Labilibacter sediminis]
MNNHLVKVKLSTNSSIHIHLKGVYFFGEKQQTLIGDWKISLYNNQLYFENDNEIIIGDEEVILSPVRKEECGFQITDKQKNKAIYNLCNTYKGNLIFKKSEDQIVVYNEVDIESFVRSILCRQFPNCNELEFLKTQAVILRSSVLHYCKFVEPAIENTREEFLTSVLQYVSKETPLFLDSSCENLFNLYQGFPKKCNQMAHVALEDTRGKVLVYNDQVFYVPQAVCCGGVINEYFKDKSSQSDNLNKHKYDAEQIAEVDLSEVSNLEHFIYNPVSCYCDTDDEKLISQLISRKQSSNVKLFRWNKVLKSLEISLVLNNRLNINIGKVIDFKVENRSTGGRVVKVLIQGEKSKAILSGSNLTALLKGLNLQGNSFIVEKSKGVKYNREVSFTLNGAGTGMDEGVCQLGALYMANNGKSMENIIQHYLGTVYIEKQY